MKTRISATIDKATEKILKEIVKKENDRNQSHAIEELIKKRWKNIKKWIAVDK